MVYIENAMYTNVHPMYTKALRKGQIMKMVTAKLIAEEWVERLKPGCERIEIAGSIRRRKAEVKDIEIVALPQSNRVLEVNIFNQPTKTESQVDLILADMLRKGEFLGLTRNGNRFKQIKTMLGIKIDLFLVMPPAQWGVIYVLRTGPKGFSHWLVTSSQKGGALPANYQVRDGELLYHGQALSTPEEVDFFGAIGLGWIPPEEREKEGW